MQQTANFNIDYTDGTDPMNLQAITGAMATSVDDALVDITNVRQLHSFVVADSGELSALTGMTAGDTAFQQDIGALYVYTGADWRPYSTTDTGWVTIPYDAGFKTHASAPKIEYRVKDGVFYLRGGGTNDAEALTPGTIYTMVSGGVPAEYRPPAPVSGGAYGNSGRTGGMNVETNGNVNFATNNGTSGNASYIRGSLSYPIG